MTCNAIHAMRWTLVASIQVLKFTFHLACTAVVGLAVCRPTWAPAATADLAWEGRKGACTTSWMPCAEAELSEGFEVHTSPWGLRFTLHLLQGLKPLTSPCTAVVGLAVCLQANMYCIQGEGQGQGHWGGVQLPGGGVQPSK